jgi:hypothetical protein
MMDGWATEKRTRSHCKLLERSPRVMTPLSRGLHAPGAEVAAQVGFVCGNVKGCLGQYPPMFDSVEHLLNTYSRVPVRQPVVVAHSTGDCDDWWNDNFAWNWMNLVAGLVRGDVCAVDGLNELAALDLCAELSKTAPLPQETSICL